jgi:hypothetical protein
MLGLGRAADIALGAMAENFDRRFLRDGPLDGFENFG